MPYIVVKSNGQEIARRELFDGLTVGRAQECDLVIRDISLSRKHARFHCNPCSHGGPAGWRIVDLQSKNGTIVNTTLIPSRIDLVDNDIIRIGRNKILFFSDVPQGFIDDGPPPVRPADPSDSLSGTLSGFTLLLPGESDPIPADRPSPLPRPKEPAAYENEDLRQLLTAIASSSWDSIYAQARQPLRAMPAQNAESVDALDQPRRRIHRPRNPVDWSLQAEHSSPQKSAAAAPVARRLRRAIVLPQRNLRHARRRVRPQLPIFAAALWLTAGCIFVCKVTESGPSPLGPSRAAAAQINSPKSAGIKLPVTQPQPDSTLAEVLCADAVHPPVQSSPSQRNPLSILRTIFADALNSQKKIFLPQMNTDKHR